MGCNPSVPEYKTSKVLVYKLCHVLYKTFPLFPSFPHSRLRRSLLRQPLAHVSLSLVPHRPAFSLLFLITAISLSLPVTPHRKSASSSLPRTASLLSTTRIRLAPRLRREFEVKACIFVSPATCCWAWRRCVRSTRWIWIAIWRGDRDGRWKGARDRLVPVSAPPSHSHQSDARQHGASPLAPPPAKRSVRLSPHQALPTSTAPVRSTNSGGEARGPEPARCRGRRGGAGDDSRGASQRGLGPTTLQRCWAASTTETTRV